MDGFLEEKCPTLLKAIRKENKVGYTFYDICRDPFNNFLYDYLNDYSQQGADRFIEDNHDEVEAAIDFAEKYDIDTNEWDLSDAEKRFSFAISYLSYECELDVEYEKEYGK